MKYYNKSHYSKAMKGIGMDAKLKRDIERHVIKYSKLAFKFIRPYVQSMDARSESKIGILDVNDIVQIAFEGLIVAWNRVDWEKIDASENWQKTLVNYLSSNIQGNLKRRIYQEATGVNVPEYQINKTKQEKLADALFGRWLYSFRLQDEVSGYKSVLSYINIIEYDPIQSSSFMNDELNDDLTTLMFKHLTEKERNVLRWNYGIDDDRLTESQIAEKLNMTDRGVRKIKARALDKLNNEESEFILKDFL